MFSLQAALLDRVTPKMRAVGAQWSEREIRAWFLYDVEDVEALAHGTDTAELVSDAETQVMCDFDVDVTFEALPFLDPRSGDSATQRSAGCTPGSRTRASCTPAGAPLRRLVRDYRARRLAAEPFCRRFPTVYEA